MATQIKKSDAVKELENLVHQYRLQKDPFSEKKYYAEHNTTELEKCIILYCELLKRRGFKVFAVRVQTMGRQILKDGNPIFVRQNNYTGKADISVIIEGKAIEVEVKCKYTKDRYQNEAQKKFERQILRAGGIYWLIRDFAEFKMQIDNYFFKLQQNEKRN